jgi:acetyl esterase/lipase
LYDFYDAWKYVLKYYKSFISDADQVYYLGGSGGGGNGYALIGKFPDMFCSAVVSCGISDYAEWFEKDTVGEFRDEMLPWIGCTPQQNREAYESRSGLSTVKNLLTPVYIIHGETDGRVPVSHARNFVTKARKSGKEVYYLELKNVGNRNHWGNISEEQDEAKRQFSDEGLKLRYPPELPDKGKLIVAGYLVTKYFSVFLNSLDSVGLIEYDIQKHEVKLKKGKGKIVWNKS